MAGTDKKRIAKAQAKTRRKKGFDKLDRALETALDDYFKLLDGQSANRLHKLVLGRVEKKLLSYVLKLPDYNQSRTAETLGLSRSTLRSKIRAHGLSVKKKRASSQKR